MDDDDFRRKEESLREKRELLKKLKEQRGHADPSLSAAAPAFIPSNETGPVCGYADDDDDFDFDEEDLDDMSDDMIFEDDDPTEGSGTATAAVKVGEFGLLALAKRGNLDEFRNIEAAEQHNVRGIADNVKRNPLHFAADSGNLPLVEYLLKQKVSACAIDEKGLTPTNIAKLAGHEDCVAALEKASGSRSLSIADLIRRHCPAPPKFALSKPAPTAVARAAGQFWGTSGPRDTDSEVNASELLASVDERVLPFLLEQGKRPTLSDGPGLQSWTAPATSPENFALFARHCHNVVATDKSGVTGFAGFFPLGNLIISGEAQRAAAYVAGLLTATSSQQALRVLRCADSYFAGCHCVFATNRILPKSANISPVSTFKWFRRCLDAATIFKNSLQESGKAVQVLFPDYEKYETVLRTEHILKGTVVGCPCGGWTPETRSESIAAFLSMKCASRGLSVAFTAQSVSHLLAAGVLALGRNDANGEITDIAFLRLHRSVSCTTVVAALALLVLGSAKLLEVVEGVCVAAHAAGAHVLFAPTLGSTADGLVQAGFDEVTGSHQHLYVVASTEQTAVPKPVKNSDVVLPLVI